MTNTPLETASPSLQRDAVAAHAVAPQLARFICVGAASFALNLLVLWLGTSVIGAHYLASTLFSLIFVNGLSFCLQRGWVFASRSPDWKRELGRFYGVNSGAFAINLGAMALLVSGFHLPYLAASALIGVALTAFNFVLHRNWSFARR